MGDAETPKKPAASQITQAQQPAGQEAKEGKPHWWHGVPWIGLLPRLALAVVGLAALAVGLKAARSEDAATPALIVGAVLLALALIFTPDLTELSGRYKDAAITYRRGAAGAYAEYNEILSAALAEGGDENLRRTIQDLAAESGRAAVREALDAQSTTTQRQTGEFMKVLLRQLRGQAPPPTRVRVDDALLFALGTTPIATHAWDKESNLVTLKLINPPPAAVACTVTRPDNRRDTRVTFSLAHATGVSLTYPEDFTGASPLSPGRYKVEWRDLKISSVTPPRIEADPVVATDEFEVPEDAGNTNE